VPPRRGLLATTSRWAACGLSRPCTSSGSGPRDRKFIRQRLTWERPFEGSLGQPITFFVGSPLLSACSTRSFDAPDTAASDPLLYGCRLNHGKDPYHNSTLTIFFKELMEINVTSLGTYEVNADSKAR
jgi:hypothetical protein